MPRGAAGPRDLPRTGALTVDYWAIGAAQIIVWQRGRHEGKGGVGTAQGSMLASARWLQREDGHTSKPVQQPQKPSQPHPTAQPMS